jgi:hypothetical protein
MERISRACFFLQERHAGLFVLAVLMVTATREYMPACSATVA